jgi:hypothetical protein
MSDGNFEYFFTKVLGYEMAPFHREWLKEVQETNRTVIICSRDHGKSVFFHSWCVYQLIFQEPPYQMLYISSNHKQTMVHMKDIDRMFSNNPIIKKFKPKAGWAVGAMRLTNGNEILERSVGSQIRGLHPQEIIIDDPLKEFSMNVRRYPAINQAGEALWPGRWDKDKLEQRKLEIGSSKFTREYLCIPISTNTMLFDPEHVEACKDRDAVLTSTRTSDDLRYFIGYDPAISANGDWTVMTVLEVDDDMNKKIVQIFRAQGLDFREHIMHIMDLCRRYQPETVMIETNTFAKAFAMEFTMSRKKKQEIILNLQMNIDNHKIVFPYGNEESQSVCRQLIQELEAFGINHNGKIEGVGAHDDMVISLALANYATKKFSDVFTLLDDEGIFNNGSPSMPYIGGGIRGIN